MTRRRTILISDIALRDMEEIRDFIAEESGAAVALQIFDGLEACCESLGEFSERGNRPKELLALGVVQYRELHFKPYRLIYGMTSNSVIVHAVLDGRRDVRSVLQRRLLQKKRS